MARSDSLNDDGAPAQPLIGGAALNDAAEAMLSASRAMLAVASAVSPGLGAADARARELTADAVEAGFLRALRRDSLLGGPDQTLGASSLFGLPSSSQGIPGAGYGRMGASVTGHGARAQLYGTIGGAIGFAVGGPAGAFLGGMLGGLFGGDNSGAEQAQQQEQIARQWLNSPQEFGDEAYLYNLILGSHASSLLAESLKTATATTGRAASARVASSPVIVNLSPGAVQITGSGAEAGEQAARAFAGELGRVLRLNSVVVPAAGFGEV